MGTKFKVGDRVYNAITEKWGTITAMAEKGNAMVFADVKQKTTYFPNDTKVLGFVEEKIKMSDEFYRRPEKSWKELENEIINCEKEWGYLENNISLCIFWNDEENKVASYGHNEDYQEIKQHYKKDVINLIEQVNDLGYVKEFESWLLNKDTKTDLHLNIKVDIEKSEAYKSLAENLVADTEPTFKLTQNGKVVGGIVGHGEPKEDYPILTGLEPVGTVGYMNGVLSEICDIIEGSCDDCVKILGKCVNNYCSKKGRKDGKSVYYKKVTKRA